MGYETERAAIATYLTANWASTPIQWPNIKFDPPDKGEWLRVNILRGQSAAAGLMGDGAVKYRHPAVLQIDVLFEQLTGTKVAGQYADQVAALFRGKHISGLLFQGPSITQVTEQETSREFLAVSIPFQRDEVFNI